MNNPFFRAPHVAGPNPAGSDRVGNAALLIDFDNVTMGIRSDLSRELRTLLDSEVIRGKVAVQRAYADWRRYPQYIVPLSEASIDLIFAPAYGSSKKNATDIRLAIDALELVFIRPEIGTFILLSGDSDFSSLVLKLKEYGKFVIGVGLQESSSDILVQNCDEYYSYNSLTGLTKTDEADRVEFDPWVLVEKAVERMVERRDVMRSDRLKQVMVEIDPSFEERKFGFAKFSKFLAEAAGKGLLELRKLENGQFEVGPGKKRRGGKRTRRSARPTREDRAAEATQSASPTERSEPRRRQEPEVEVEETEADERPDSLDRAYSLMRTALEELQEAGRDPARDSDVKRRLLKLRPSFDEAEYGFSKFSKFLKQAADDHIVRIDRLDNGQFEVSLPGSRRATKGEDDGERKSRRKDGESRKRDGNGRRGRGRTGGSRRDEGDDSSDASEAPTASEGSTTATDRRERGEGGRGRRESRPKEGADEAQADAHPQAKSEPSREPARESRKEPEEQRAAAPQAEAVAPRTEAVAPKTEAVTPRESAPRATSVAEGAAARAADTGKQLAGESQRGKGGLLPRSQKRGRGPDGPPPIFEGQAVKVPTRSPSSDTGDASEE